MHRMKFSEFIEHAINDCDILSDFQDVLVDMGDFQWRLPVESVIGRKEKRPFEAAYVLERNPGHPAWEELYDQYIDYLTAKAIARYEGGLKDGN